jgi:hypothetical protein
MQEGLKFYRRLMNFGLKLSALRQARFKGLNKWRKSRMF